jgi:hypothetical protein
MKKNLFISAMIALMMCSYNLAKAQYCFWVANESTETFDELRLREHGTGAVFGPDILPYNLIKPRQHFWVKTLTGEEMWDVEIIRENGTPLRFTYTDRAGYRHENQGYITVNARLLHTLVIDEDEDGTLSFGYYETDQLGYGDPCSGN